MPNLGSRLGETENVVYEEKHVLVLFIAEVLGFCQAGESHPEARSWRFGHLAVDECGLLNDSRFLHLEPEVVPLAGSFSHSGEDRETTVMHRNPVNHLHDDDCLADPCPSEQADLPSKHIGFEQINHFDAGLEHFGFCALLIETGSRTVNRVVLLRLEFTEFIDGLTYYVQDTAERLAAHRNADRLSGINRLHAANHPLRRLHADAANAVLTKMLLHFGADTDGIAGSLSLDDHAIVNGRETVLVEFAVHYGTNDLHYFSGVWHDVISPVPIPLRRPR